MEEVRQSVVPAIFRVLVLCDLVEPLLVHVEGNVLQLAELGECLERLLSLESLAEATGVLGHAELLFRRMVVLALAHGERVEQDVACFEERVSRLVLHVEQTSCFLAIRIRVLQFATSTAEIGLLLEHGG